MLSFFSDIFHSYSIFVSLRWNLVTDALMPAMFDVMLDVVKPQKMLYDVSLYNILFIPKALFDIISQISAFWEI